MRKSRWYRFHLCIYWERGNKGRYIGLMHWWEFELFPWGKNDGDRGFLEWLLFRGGWYPIKPQLQLSLIYQK